MTFNVETDHDGVRLVEGQYFSPFGLDRFLAHQVCLHVWNLLQTGVPVYVYEVESMKEMRFES